jgi:hypothetical protein
MLALLAALVLSPNRILPEPFIGTPLAPVLSVDALASYTPESVARGSVWRQGGLVRLTYYYKFKPRSGPTHKDIMRQQGFNEEVVVYGSQSGERAYRDVDSIRQTVRIIDIDEGVYWPWANIGGPGRIAIVTETPFAPTAKWHQVLELSSPPVPAGFASQLPCLANAEIIEVRSDPLIPRSFRSTFTVYVRLATHQRVDELADSILRELPTNLWKTRRFGTHVGIGLKTVSFGLHSIDIDKYSMPDKRFTSEATLAYLYADAANAPRLTD